MKTFIEPMNDASTPNAMRAEFERLSYYDLLVRAVFDVARHQGMSGEDKYVALAFNAIRQLKTLQEQHFEVAMTTIRPHVIVKEQQ